MLPIFLMTLMCLAISPKEIPAIFVYAEDKLNQEDIAQTSYPDIRDRELDDII